MIDCGCRGGADTLSPNPPLGAQWPKSGFRGLKWSGHGQNASSLAGQESSSAVRVPRSVDGDGPCWEPAPGPKLRLQVKTRHGKTWHTAVEVFRRPSSVRPVCCAVLGNARHAVCRQKPTTRYPTPLGTYHCASAGYLGDRYLLGQVPRGARCAKAFSLLCPESSDSGLVSAPPVVGVVPSMVGVGSPILSCPSHRWQVPSHGRTFA